MTLEIRLRFIAGITMVVLLISILLSGVNELNLLLMTAIQVKVFQVIRSENLPSPHMAHIIKYHFIGTT